jgi:hypothetical protein
MVWNGLIHRMMGDSLYNVGVYHYVVEIVWNHNTLITHGMYRKEEAPPTFDSCITADSTTMWRPIDLDENSCNGICVKWMGAVSCSGTLLPIVYIISGVSKEEMPDDEFMVAMTDGLCHNSHMSDCDKRPVYVCFLRKDSPADHFFAWYYTSIVLPTIELTRQRNGLPKEEKAVLYLDSDPPNLKHLTSQLMMAKNVDD